jgi:hypothetical protein
MLLEFVVEIKAVPATGVNKFVFAKATPVTDAMQAMTKPCAPNRFMVPPGDVDIVGYAAAGNLPVGHALCQCGRFGAELSLVVHATSGQRRRMRAMPHSISPAK